MWITKNLGSLIFIFLTLGLIFSLFEINTPFKYGLVIIFIILTAIVCFFPNIGKNIQRLIVIIFESIWLFFDF